MNKAHNGLVQFWVKKQTRQRVKDFRLKDETQDDAINRALDIAERRIAETQGTGQEP